MIVGGIDIGAKTIKVVILKDGQVIARAMGPAGLEAKTNAEKVLAAALAEAGLDRKDVDHWCATGVGRNDSPVPGDAVTEVTAAARAAHQRYPEVMPVIEVGAEEGRAVRVDDSGRVADFAVNEKCAAGAGAFTEAMARALDVPLNTLGELSLKATRSIPMNAQCAVFAESEVVTLVHQKTAKEDIARAVHDAIADRIVSMARKVGIQREIMLAGGMAHNVGFVDSLKRKLEVDQLVIPEDPDYIGAYGAAITAASRAA